MGLKWKKNEIIVNFIYWDRVSTALVPTIEHMYMRGIHCAMHGIAFVFLRFQLAIYFGYSVANQEDQVNTSVN